MTMTWPAPAKLNLFLSILGRRLDGYHLLQTLFQLLDYSDTLTITTKPGGKINLYCASGKIIKNNNIITQAAYLLQNNYWKDNNSHRLGADIILNKKIPIGSGLGGGSSNAATTLVALNKQWKCNMNVTQLAKLGLMLGADVPLFIHGKTAFAENIGEQLTPIILQEKWFLITVPSISISTSVIFNDPKLKRNSKPHIFTELFNKPFYNDCEPIVKKRFPEIKKHLSFLMKYAPSRLTGTGSCIFTEFHNESIARYVMSKIPAWMTAFIAKGINTSPIHYIK